VKRWLVIVANTAVMVVTCALIFVAAWLLSDIAIPWVIGWLTE
jgi:hypothetical protein